MPYIKPFSSVRPSDLHVTDVAALPYDVYNRSEAYEIVKKNPLSFLSIDRAETNFEPGYDLYAKEVYEKKKIFQKGFIYRKKTTVYIFTNS